MGEHFEQVVLPAVDALYNLARRLERDPMLAEDLAQETLARAWKSWSAGTRPDPPGGWLATICLNIARDRARRNRPEVSTAEPLDAPAAVDVAEEAIVRLRLSEVEEALARLPEPQRMAITLMDVCGLSASEVAEATDTPRGTVLARAHRGRRALARAVVGEGAPEPPGDSPSRHGRRRGASNTERRNP